MLKDTLPQIEQARRGLDQADQELERFHRNLDYVMPTIIAQVDMIDRTLDQNERVIRKVLTRQTLP